MNRRPNPFYHPDDVSEVIELFEEEFQLQKIPARFDASEEAEKFFELMTVKKEQSGKEKWTHKGLKINDWVKFAQTHISYLKDKVPGKAGFASPKEVILLNDCCWRSDIDCDCTLRLSPGDSNDSKLNGFDALSAALDGEIDARYTRAALWLELNVHKHELTIASEHDGNYYNSSRRGLARTLMLDNPNEYFSRMAVWIEFISRSGDLTDLQREMCENYGKWLMSNSLPLLIDLCDKRDKWELFNFTTYPYKDKIKQKPEVSDE